MRIAIVDESATRATIIEDGLAQIPDCQIFVLTERRGLLARIDEIGPDIVLIDLGNPSRDVLEEYFAVSRALARPIAMFVEESDDDMIGASIDAGVSAYVVDGLAAHRIRPLLDLAVRRFNAFARLQTDLAEAKGKLAERDAIDKAKRILMQSKGVSEPEAYAELRRKAMSSNRRIADIAEAVVTAHELMIGDGEMTEPLTIGFLPLVDACLPILAHEHGFAEEEGLALSFQRDVSWATVLDRLLYGHSDAAHLIAPLAIATTLGRGRPAQPLAAPFVLGLNGNAITLTPELAARVTEPGKLADPVALGAALAKEAMARKAAGKRLHLGVVHRYSSHSYKLRYWLAASGIRPDEDVEIVTIAPPFVADAMETGEIDGACVGEPWNSAAVDRGVGVIVLATAQIWRRGVEKVLAFRAPVLEARRPAAEALIRAMRKAGAHFVDPANWEANAAILARPEYVGADPKLILNAISDRLVLVQGADPVSYPDFMFQHREAANFPWVSQAEWLYTQLVRWDHLAYSAADAEAAARVFRPDVYRSALAGTGDMLPGASSKVEGSLARPTAVTAQQGAMVLANNSFFDGRSFDPDDVEGYIASFA